MPCQSEKFSKKKLKKIKKFFTYINSVFIGFFYMGFWHGGDDSKNGGIFYALPPVGSHFFDVFLRQIVDKGVK